MFKTRPSSLLPTQLHDLRGRSKSSARSYISSRRTRFAVASILVFCVVLFLFAFSHPLSISYPESSNRVDVDEPLAEQVEEPPRPLLTITPPPTAPPTGDTVWKARADQVKDAFVRGYSAYYELAFPHDELLPKTNGTGDK